MSDGSRLRQSWYSALRDAETHFRQLLTSPAAEWKRLTHLVDGSPSKQKGKLRASAVPELGDVIVHRNSTKSGDDVYRMVLDVPTGEEQMSLEPWKAVLTTPELRQEWDPAVEDAHLVEMFDRNTRISKTNYTLGWPANPRDSITISRAFYDTTTLIDITTSLPRSSDEPAYLRPSPPFVRSHVQLFAWCIQYIQPQPASPTDSKKPGSTGRLRITCFWQHDLKALWGFGSSMTALTQQLSTMTLSLLKTVIKRGGRVPKLAGYGNGVSIERLRYQTDREALTIDYAIIPDDEEHSIHHELGLQGMDEVHALREHRRLTRSIECVLPSLEGWDVQVTMKGSSEEVENIPWSAHAMRSSSNPSIVSSPDQVLLRLTHGALTHDDAVLKVKVVIEVSGATRGLRLNGLATKIHDLEERDPSSHIIPQKILQDVASAVDLSIQTSSSIGTVSSTASSTSGMPHVRPNVERTPAAEKSILSKVRRNYIYFSSLLQEPEAKWKRTTEARGVSITQLDSIDPTLVVYRAEATFVGVGLWDLYGAVVSPGARVYWDKQHEDGVLLEDVNELTELWHFKTKPAWPVNGRDSVVLKTVYKSPTTIHVFSFSADDPHLFPHIPPAEPNVIRTQVDLQGWAIEALSPTTTLLTLLEQSDPKGWTNKTSIPTQMINTLAGIGEFAIKCGGPPVVTRLAGAKANELRYDHERGMFKVEYEPSASRRSTSTLGANGKSDGLDNSGLPAIECEIRCDIDTWASSLDIVVDPPPQTITCLRRHRLSAEGGGLWLTLIHDSIFVDDERLLALVRRAPGKEKGLVMVNGAKVQVDVEELPEHEIKSLTRQKRVKPPRIPLDQPPVMGVIKRRKAEWSGADEQDPSSVAKEDSGASGTRGTAPRISSPLSRFFTYAVDQATTTTQQAVAAISPANMAATSSMALDSTKLPMQYALEALAWTQEFNSKPQTQDGWTLVGDKGVIVQRKVMPEISPFIPVHKGFKVIEGVSAEELAAVINEFDCRKTWDERYDSARVLESYGGQARTTFLVAKGGFPFRDRGFYLANVMAREHMPLSSLSRRNTGEVAEQSPTARNAIFCVSASFSPDSAKAFSPEKYNSYALPIGRVYVDAWILETLDPYTKENYAIPSSRCTRLVAVDYAGSIPAAFNSMINATLARGVLAVESYMKNNMKAALPITRLPAPGLVVSEKKPEEHGAPSSVIATGAGDGIGAGVVISAPFMAWKLRKRDENRVLLETQFETEKKLYRTSVLVVMPSRPGANSSSKREPSSATIIGPPSGGNTTSATTTAANDKTPRPSQLTLTPSPSDRRRQPSDQSLPETIYSARSDSTLTPNASNINNTNNNSSNPSNSSSMNSLTTPMLPMPGSMAITPGLPSSATFPSASSSYSSPSSMTSSAFRPGTSDSSSSSVSPSRPSSSSLSVSPPPRIRQRAASSGSGTLSTHPSGFGSGMTAHHPDGTLVRGRTTSSAFTTKGEVKLTTDLVVMEVVVDSKMFRCSDARGGYAVEVRVRKRARLALRQDGMDALPLSGLGSGVDSMAGSVLTASSSTSSTLVTTDTTNTQLQATIASDVDVALDLPFIYTVHTMPSSPLHSSGLSAESPSRHLLRLTLPTAQYRVSSVKDPLTGEMRGAPPKPAWLEEMEKEGGGVVVEIVVRPLGAGEGEKETKDKGKDGSKDGVWINGKEVPVIGEKESLTSLGREELLDDRTARMGVLSRIPNDAEPLPEELKAPIAVADDLLLPTAASGQKAGDQVNGAQQLKTEENENNALETGSNSEDTPGTPKSEAPATGGPHVAHVASSGPGGLLGFFQAYPNPLTRFTVGASATASAGGSGSKAVTGSSGGGPLGLPGTVPGGLGDDVSGGSSSGAISVAEVAGAAQVQRQRVGGSYPLSTLVCVGLIAFLIGSLLRSLLSPADFIYVVTDLREAENANSVGGWREIRRLLEIKYLVGGWDFQVAVVRRH
ncbi:hypothetical protein BDZ97DRAFT_1782409 [Flammula alnicola]|nr:hypothetical protein BDZ97DRAFT_1782409 [Flammula alnicola]